METLQRFTTTSLRRNPTAQEKLQQHIATSWSALASDEADADLDPVDWILANFYIPELDGPIELYPYQIATLKEAYKRDDEGNFVYNTVMWGDIKKSAKSCIAAAVTLERSTRNKWFSGKIVANDLKQADSRVAYFFRRALELDKSHSKGDTYNQSGYTIKFPNSSVVEAIPIDPGGEAGGNDHLICFSELWAAKHKAIKQMWTEMTRSPLLFGQSQRWIETYAGYSGESPLLERLYTRGVKEGEKLDLSYTDTDGRYHDLTDLEVYANGGLLCLWNTTPRLPWQTAEYYAAEMEDLHPDEFSRIHRNQWISSTSKFVPAEWWEMCGDGDLPKFHPKEPVVAALDAGVSDDCFALVAVTNRKMSTFVRHSKIWVPPKGGKIDFLGTVEEPGPEREIVKLCWLNNVVEVRYDPTHLHDMATRLKKGVPIDKHGNIVEAGNRYHRIFKVNMIAFLQGQPRLRADKQLYDKIRERRVMHSNDEDLNEHINNANSTKDKEKLRIVKRSQSLKIDAAVTLSMAAYEEEAELEPVVMTRAVYDPVRIAGRRRRGG